MKYQRYAQAAAMFLYATSALADSLPVGSGFPDNKTIEISDLHLGMSGTKAREVLAAHYAKQKSKPVFLMAKPPYSNESFLRFSAGNHAAGNISYDNISIFFSGPRSGNQAVFIRRNAQFVGSARPNRDATLAAIKERFGAPSMEFGGQTMEFYFSKGQRLTKANGNDFHACGMGSYGLDQVSQVAMQDDALQRSLRAAYTAMQNARGSCDIYVRIKWSGSYDQLGGQNIKNDNVLGRLDIVAFDYARYIATNNADVQAAEAVKDKARQSAPVGGAAPKL